MKAFRLLSMALLAFSLSACSSIENMQISNPFASTTDVSSVYTSQFPDVPIPMDMKPVLKGTLVTMSPNGQKVGVETVNGRIDLISLANAMSHNLATQGWTQRGSVQGKRTMMVFEKDSRFLVAIIDDNLLDTTMELWMVSRLEGIGGMSTPAFPNYPATYSGEGVTSQNLVK